MLRVAFRYTSLVSHLSVPPLFYSRVMFALMHKGLSHNRHTALALLCFFLCFFFRPHVFNILSDTICVLTWPSGGTGVS